uniref:Short spindle protein n=1 Tax=Anoplophora glabripennis TaxID=217634 RepID=V5I9Q3_ANOGL
MPSLQDSLYNLRLVQDFCHRCLPSSIFHLMPEDVTYMRDFMKQNLVVFLADLFNVMEINPAKCVRNPGTERFGSEPGAPEAADSRRPGQRRDILHGLGQRLLGPELPQPQPLGHPADPRQEGGVFQRCLGRSAYRDHADPDQPPANGCPHGRHRDDHAAVRQGGRDRRQGVGGRAAFQPRQESFAPDPGRSGAGRAAVGVARLRRAAEEDRAGD